MIDRFEILLKELGTVLELPLKVVKDRTCGLTVDHHLQLQLQADDAQERVLLSSFIVEVPLGRFREDIFKEALKANAQYPRPGILSYTSKNNQMMLFDYLPLAHLNSEKLIISLTEFIMFADAWKKAIESGLPSPKGPTFAKTDLPPPFGMRL